MCYTNYDTYCWIFQLLVSSWRYGKCLAGLCFPRSFGLDGLYCLRRSTNGYPQDIIAKYVLVNGVVVRDLQDKVTTLRSISNHGLRPLVLIRSIAGGLATAIKLFMTKNFHAKSVLQKGQHGRPVTYLKDIMECSSSSHFLSLIKWNCINKTHR